MKELVIRSTICLILQTKNKQQLTSEDWTPILMWNKLFCSLETKAICILDRKKSQEGTGKQRAGPSSPASAVPASTAPPTIPWDHSYLRYMQIPAPLLTESRSSLPMHTRHEPFQAKYTQMVSSFLPRHISTQATYLFKSSWEKGQDIISHSDHRNWPSNSSLL